MATEEFGGRVVNQIGALCEGLDQPGRGQRRVHQQRHTVCMGNGRHLGGVQHIQARVANRFAKKQLGIGPHRRAPAVQIARFDERGVDPEAAHRVVQQVLRAAIERGGCHDMAARAHQRGNAQVQGGLAAGHADGTDTAFQRRDALLEHCIGRVADARIDMARPLQIEERGRMVARLKHKGCGEVNRHGACAGGVWRGACMQGEGVESGVGVACHVDLFLDLSCTRRFGLLYARIRGKANSRTSDLRRHMGTCILLAFAPAVIND